MPEGESPTKGIATQIKEAWQKTKKALTGKKPRPKIRVSLPQVRILDEPTATADRPLVKAIENPGAAGHFINAIRNPQYYQVYPTPSGAVLRSSELGTEIDPNTGFFNTYSVLRAASERYNLPLAIYDSGDHHARLVVGSPRVDSATGTTRIPVYDPMRGNITEIEHPQSIPLNSRLLPNAAAEADLNGGRYDISFLNDSSLRRYRDSFLLNGKFARLQEDFKNCVPYCLFVGAMMQALKSGETPFKNQGVDQFRKDFGVQILTREEITGVRPL